MRGDDPFGFARHSKHYKFAPRVWGLLRCMLPGARNQTRLPHVRGDSSS